MQFIETSCTDEVWGSFVDILSCRRFEADVAAVIAVELER